jgi:predicted nuclease of predicted toxin-antitoxin system
MKFLVDAQLPRGLAHELANLGHVALHTLDLPNGNSTADEEINLLADAESWVVVSKDEDFVTSHLLKQTPRKLWLIATGNISNQELFQILHKHHEKIITALTEFDFVELSRTSLVVHG